jgi:Abortive infection C-terminus
MLSLADDPEDAVTAGSSIIESVCRSILIKLGVPLPDKKDIDGLMRAVQAPLGLSPGQRNIPLKVERDVRQILGGLTSVAKGVGALRTHGGDAHGREAGYPSLDAPTAASRSTPPRRSLCSSLRPGSYARSEACRIKGTSDDPLLA